MESNFDTLVILASFLVLALSAKQFGAIFVRLHLPLISGFLFAGILVGPYVLGLLPKEVAEQLRFIDEISLAVIAFAAGSELYLKELRSRMKSIGWVTFGNVLVIPLLVAVVLFWLSSALPFLDGMPPAARFAVALLAGTILIARSPSSAIAIISELRARGPFTQMVLGVTMITDVLVIVLFAVNSSVVDAVLTGLPFDVKFLGVLVLELVVEIGLGILLGMLLRALIAQHMPRLAKEALLLLLGYSVFAMAGWLREYSARALPFEVFLEPLLICLIASFYVANFTYFRAEFMKILQEIALPIYVVFFTLTGASLALDVLADTWLIALTIFGVRLLGIFLGSFAGGVVAGDPMEHNRLSWLTFITQAGVGLGLAKEVAVGYPEWGPSFATLVVSVIVVSQLVGPPFFKWAINRTGESHGRGSTTADDRDHIAFIFGLEGQAVALARSLQNSGWHVTIATRRATHRDDLDSVGVNIAPIADLSLESLQELGVATADAVITMLSNPENHQVCETVYEAFGTERIVARMNELGGFDALRAIGVTIVEPGTAMVHLLDQFVRTPDSTSLLLGLRTDQTILDVQMHNPTLSGLALRELQLPLDVLILYVRRNGSMVVSHGYSKLELGDWVTIVGSPESVAIVAAKFEGVPTGVSITP